MFSDFLDIDVSVPHPSPASSPFDAIVIGAGFAGLYMLYRLRRLGLSTRVYEAGGDVGGTWYHNRYPGARCDVESMQYSYSFDEELQQDWEWTDRFARQEEILRYINYVADRHQLRSDIRFHTPVTAASFDEAAGQWVVRTGDGQEARARFLITAAGCLSAARVPDVEGLADFKGQWFHTGAWPHEEVDFTGLRVGVVGTGSSGIQAIPVIAAQAAVTVVFQRTPNFSIPAHNRTLGAEEQQAWKADYALRREQARATRSGILYEYGQRGTFEVSADQRQAEYERRWQLGGGHFTHAFNDILIDRAANEQAAEFVRQRIRATVADPATAALLCPGDHAIGTKRICIDTDYHATFNRPNVRLHDLRQARIERVVPDGIRTTTTHYPLDAIVFATGYDAVTGALDRIDIRGRGGRALRAKWSEGPKTYLGIMTAGFPNLFMVTGPGSLSVVTNVVISIEQHVDWIARCVERMAALGHRLAEAEAEAPAEDAWVRHVNEVADKTLFPTTNSWYMGANIPGKPQVFLPYVGGFSNYTQLCEEVVDAGYRGFVFSGAETTSEARIEQPTKADRPPGSRA